MQSAQRMPLILLAAIEMPMPVPHNTIPRSDRPLTISAQTFSAMSG